MTAISQDMFGPPTPLPGSSSDIREPMTTYSSLSVRDSLLYDMLPDVVKTRIRRLPSIRRSVSAYNRVTDESDPYCSASRPSSMDYSTSRTPPPEYRSQISLSGASSDCSNGEEEVIQRDQPVSYARKRSASGVKWRFSAQGLSLLNLASEESSSIPSTSSERDPSLARQLYVHGITYLLRGLPDTLSAEEQMSVLSAVPQQVLDLHQSRLPQPEPALIPEGLTIQVADGNAPPSMLHRVLVAVIVQFFLLISFLLPHLKVLATKAYRYERRHKVTEKIFASGVGTMDAFLRRVVELGNTVCSLNDGKVGQALNSLTLWWIRGVTGGIHQGVGEGLSIMGVDGVAGLRSSRG